MLKEHKVKHRKAHVTRSHTYGDSIKAALIEVESAWWLPEAGERKGLREGWGNTGQQGQATVGEEKYVLAFCLGIRVTVDSVFCILKKLEERTTNVLTTKKW